MYGDFFLRQFQNFLKMKKIVKRGVVGIVVFITFIVVLVFIFPQLLYSTAIGQRIAMKMEGGQVADFYFKENQTHKDTLYMKGVIYSNTLDEIKDILDQNPQVTTLVMVNVPGSIDDEINLVASQEIRKRKINTYLPEDGMVASGGTDMFLAGTKRMAHSTAKLGVHSWSDGTKGGDQYPKDHPDHTKYLTYYKDMQIPTDFYWYTLKAAPAEDIHWMTPDEIKKYKITTH